MFKIRDKKNNNISAKGKQLSYAQALKKKEKYAGYLLIAPFLIMMSIFTFFVFISGFYLSLTDAEFLNAGKFVGLQNFKDALWADDFVAPDFWVSLKTTLLFTIFCLITQIPIAFMLSFVLNHIPFNKLRVVMRSAFFLPALLNTVTLAFLFRLFFNRDQGIINLVMTILGLPNNTNWLYMSEYTVYIMVFISFWQWTGFHMVYFLSQLQTISPSLYEAARIDGASPLRSMISITIPLMRPAFIFVIVTSTIGGLQMFDLAFMLYGGSGGPGGTARTLVMQIFDIAFSATFKHGLATAVGWITFVIILTFSLIFLKIFGFGKHEVE